MLGAQTLSKVQRLVLGIIVLLIVDLIWVASSELTEYLFKDTHFNQPFFTTYAKTCMFMLYLLGFIFWKPWREQCRRGNKTDSIYVPLKYEDKSSGTESDEASSLSMKRGVRFKTYAEDALLARLSYQATLRAEEAKFREMNKLTIKQVAKIAFIFCILWFFGNYSYQVALKDTEAGIVNVLSSTSGLFTLVCAAIYPSSGADKFTLSKLVAVLISISGIVLVSLSDVSIEDDIPVGALWALCGAIIYALYLVSLKRRVDHEDKLDIPMFFGLFCAVVLWPGFLILHYSGSETFKWPNGKQWLFICINGVVGTVISEGCFLTSSLIGTLSLSLTIPLTMLADVVLKSVPYNWLFYVGTIPVFLSFFAVSFLTHYENWDPVLIGVKKCLHFICRRRLLS
ncbi:hypothetical protein KUTeg_001674, partial [Tegillarca granosa]